MTDELKYRKLISEHRKRRLKPFHVFIAASLALFRRYGALNLGVVTITMEEVGRRLAAVALSENPGLRDAGPKEAILELNNMLELNPRLEIARQGDIIVIKLGRNTCRICPKGVGELELPGDLCPYFGLIRGFLNYVSGAKLKIADAKTPVKKHEDYCILRLIYRNLGQVGRRD